MQVLILAVASLIVLIAIVVLASIADRIDARALRKQVKLASAGPPGIFSIVNAFDPAYSVLWEAPIEALQLANAAGFSGIPAARLRAIYKRAAARFPEIYDGCDFAGWLQFLEKMQLISWNGVNVVLTPDGKAFLRFRFVTESMVEV